MSFSSFYDQPLRQILSEVIKLSRREKARHDANILATSSKALPDIALEIPQIDFDNATPKVNEPSLVGIDRALRQIENARKLLEFKESATNGTVSVIPIKTKKYGTVPAVADAGLDRIRAAHSISDITDSPIEASRRVFGSEETISNDAVPLVPVKSKARNSVPVATDVGLHQIKDAQFTSDVTDPQKASQVIVGSEEAVSNEAISIVPVMFEEHSAVTVATDVGLDRIKAALCTPDVTDSSVKVANSTCDVAVSPVKVCKYFLSRRGCRYKHNCQSFHDHNAMANPREQWAANDAKNKLQQVRTNQQTAFMREVLALKSNNANIPVAVAKPSKLSPERSLKKKRPACKNFQSSVGCVRKNFPFPHDEPEKLIDDTVPGELLEVSNTISSSQVPKYPKAILHKRKTKKKSPKATVVKTSEPEQVFSAAKPIVWGGNPNLGDEAYCTRAILQIFGKFAPTKEEAIEWCKEMGVNRNFRHFNNFDNLTMWGRAINLNTDEFLIHIGYLPEIPVQFTFKMQLYIKELRAAYEAEQARPKYDTFHRFDDLPNELCMKIWGFAVRSGRTLTVSLNRDTIYTEGGPGLFKRRRGTSPSPLWLVNKQAQKACMLDKSCAFYFGCDYFSSRFDTLFLNDSAENFNLYATQIAQWRGNVVQRLSFPHYRLCDITDMRLFATSLYKAFPNLIRLEFSLSDGEYWSKYREKAHKVVEGADTEIAKVYKRRGANIKLPRVRFVLVPEEQAMGMGIGGIGW
ncbi:uncharacterized protein Bfra_009959 [Botrytis fragariae]|uniref:C3H1-type domain-containing protein n=1 Tax=Botrytis fragariae TaxID=1964551 RepID=A0A8H6EG15_9HELO|nr:uncharacterized protein Bfra_009959 [Botrytis fragariae]KAF5870570.1 hypothetical protein Bfra_009959 [Botrytis fragariae]